MGRLKCEDGIVSPNRLAKDLMSEKGESLQTNVDTREAALQAAQIETLYQAGRGLESCSRILDEGVTSWL